MTIWEALIAEIQELLESLVQEISNFIDRNHQAKTAIDPLEGDRAEAYAQWFEDADGLENLKRPRSTARFTA